MNFSKPLIKVVLLALISFIAAPIQGFAQSSPHVLTLEDCLRTALKKATSVQTAENSLKLTGAQVLRSYGRFLPTVSANAGYTLYSSTNTLQQTAITQVLPSGDTLNGISTSLYGTTRRGANFGITSSLNIFNGLADIGSLNQSLNNEDAAKFSLQRAKEQIALDIAQAYLQVLLNQELLRISKENLTSSSDRLRQISEQTKLGSKAIADRYQQEAQVGSDELSVINAENTLRNSKLALLRRLRIDPSGEYEFTVPEADTVLLGREYQDETLLIKSALEKRVDLKSAEHSMEAQDWGVTQAWSGYYPSLDFNFNFSSSGVLIDKQTINGIERATPDLPSLWKQLSDQTNTSLSLNLNWSIFDGFLTNLNIQQAKVSYQNSKLNYEDLKLQVITEVKQAIGDYNAGVKQLESTERGLISSQKAFETVQERYQVGSATFVELAAARALLVQAQSSRAQATYNFTFQKKVLSFYLGNISVDSYQ
ncbi:MAG: TolC family protein [Chlorobiales bacterium]|nr:TolC family protein [Chlorobiales bacterium]